jgi:hypothetical protein
MSETSTGTETPMGDAPLNFTDAAARRSGS